MTGGGGGARDSDDDLNPPLPHLPTPPINGGEFLLRLVQNPHQPLAPPPSLLPSLPHQQLHNLSLDPAVAAVGPPLPSSLHDPSFPIPPGACSFSHTINSPSPPYPPNFFLNGFPSNPTGPQHHHLRRPPNFGVPHHQKQLKSQTNQHHHNPHNHQQGPSNFVFGTVPFHTPNEGLLRPELLDREASASNAKLESWDPRESGISDFDWGNELLPKIEVAPTRKLKGYGRPELRTGSHSSGFLGKHLNRVKGFDKNVGGDVASSSSRSEGDERRELGISDSDVGNQLLKLRDHEASLTRWSPSRGHKPVSKNKGYEHNVSRGRARNTNNNELNHREYSSGSRNHGKETRFVDVDRDNGTSFRGSGGVVLSDKLDLPGLPEGNTLHSESASSVEESVKNLHAEEHDNGDGDNDDASGSGEDDIGDLSNQLANSTVDEESNGKHSGKKKHRDKDFRCDPRGQRQLNQRMRYLRSFIECRVDLERLNAPFLALFESLKPAEEEKAKQKQLLSSLEKLVNKEWPDAKLFLYGSCANSFGVSKSDIDVCLAIGDQDINKSEILLKLAEILESGNLQDVQALTRARVPIVKLKDPVMGISCDICINNVLAVVNTKLLRDYAEIDVRLRQLAFIVKHWAKCRGVNETYQGTLSSYAYVLMCIHFLQHQRPAILPCLQMMRTTYSVTIDGVECQYFDQVERLHDFGARNREGIARLVWRFFNYWAYHHDYANSVISVRTGSILSKQMKDWTRRIGNDRHLICIEDPFETSHDLGRVVDRHSIRVLREEFERAAEIMQYDPNPCVSLFETFVPS